MAAILSLQATAPAKAAQEESLEEILSSKQLSYIRHGPRSFESLLKEQKGSRQAIHIEAASQPVLIQNLNSSIFFTHAAKRHAQAAASILNDVADQETRENARQSTLNVPVLLIDAVSSGVQDIGAEYAAGLRAALERAAVITNSEYVEYDKEYPSTTHLTGVWRAVRSKDVIVVTATGNRDSLKNQDIVFPRQPLNAFTGGDAVLRVGAVKKGTVTGYSLCNNPDLVAANPFDRGYSYKYVKTRQELERLLEQRWENLKSHYYETAISVVAEENVLPAQDAHFFLPSESFLKKQIEAEENRLLLSAEEQDYLWHRARQGWQTEVQPILDQYDKDWADKADADIFDLTGTSFSGPLVGGYVALHRNLYTNLTDIDFAVAASLASRRELALEHEIAGKLSYVPNDRGLFFNSTCAGWGAFDPERFAAITKMMSQTVARQPQLASKPLHIESTALTENESNEVYSIRVTNDAMALRVLGQVTFKGKIPAFLIVRSPEGAEYPISPAIARGNTLVFSTPAFLGSKTKGNWQIEFPDMEDASSFEIGSASLTLHAVKRRSVINRAIKATTTERKPVQQFSDLKRSSPAP